MIEQLYLLEAILLPIFYLMFTAVLILSIYVGSYYAAVYSHRLYRRLRDGGDL